MKRYRVKYKIVRPIKFDNEDIDAISKHDAYDKFTNKYPFYEYFREVVEIDEL